MIVGLKEVLTGMKVGGMFKATVNIFLTNQYFFMGFVNIFHSKHLAYKMILFNNLVFIFSIYLTMKSD